VGECFFWYRPTRVVPDKRPLNGCVCVCIFLTVLFDSISQVIDYEDRLRNDLFCAEWGVKLYSNQPSLFLEVYSTTVRLYSVRGRTINEDEDGNTM